MNIYIYVYIYLELRANIGTDSLYAANVRKDVLVLAVKPVLENILRIHKVGYMNNDHNQFRVCSIF